MKDTLYVDRAAAHFKKDDYASSEADFSQAIKLNPNVANYYVYRGTARICAGKFLDGFKFEIQCLRLKYRWMNTFRDMEMASKMSPNNVDIKHRVEIALQLISDPQNAAKFLEENSKELRVSEPNPPISLAIEKANLLEKEKKYFS
jgi:tetratricopeptide (TPR) repeat protein